MHYVHYVHFVEEVREIKNHLDVEQYRRIIVALIALNMPHSGMNRGLTANLPGPVKWTMAPNRVPKTGGRDDVAAMRPWPRINYGRHDFSVCPHPCCCVSQQYAVLPITGDNGYLPTYGMCFGGDPRRR
jgi:hypothetical protein